MSLLDRCRNAAAEQVRLLGELVVIEQGGNRIELPMVPSKPEALVDDPESMLRLEHVDLEWRFVAADFVVNGRRATPEPGARIRRFVNGSQRFETYEVLPLPGQQCWWSVDAGGTILGVHCKRVHK